jgi:hypothetical protein
MLEAIVCPEWEYRYYSYDSCWGVGEAMASMRNGEGDDWFLLFGPFGAGIKGLAHESPLAGDAELLAQARRCVPAEFAPFLDEPAFSWAWMSFCYWSAAGDAAWSRVVHPLAERAELADGAPELLALLHEPASAYVEFAQGYYECSLPLGAVEAIYRGDPLTPQLVQALNEALSLADVAAEAQQIGYPLGDGVWPVAGDSR